jgi:hypothetical protein
LVHSYNFESENFLLTVASAKTPHPDRSAVFDPELRPKGAHDEALSPGRGGGEGEGEIQIPLAGIGFEI